jgi:hypothetical protein
VRAAAANSAVAGHERAVLESDTAGPVAPPAPSLQAVSIELPRYCAAIAPCCAIEAPAVVESYAVGSSVRARAPAALAAFQRRI